MSDRHKLGVVHGSALYVGALIGPGLLLVPALAVQAAGAASIVAWAALLVLSAPLAITFAALGVRHPVAGGVSAYVREGFGDAAAAVTGGWFLAAVMIGAPAVSLIGGYYVADLTGSGNDRRDARRARDVRRPCSSRTCSGCASRPASSSRSRRCSSS